MDFDFSGKRLISTTILSDISDAIREKYGTSDVIKPIDMADLIRGIGAEAEKAWYVWYMSNIAPIDGMYNSHSYSNVYVVGNELVVLYRSAPHHFSGSELVTMRCCRTNLTTWESTSEDVLTGVYYWGSVYCDGTYYIFDELMNRYTTTDFKNFEKTTYTVPSGASEPYYITVGDNNRFVSPHSNSNTKGCMIYSDDFGLTWQRATGDDVYNSTLTSHGATTKVGNTLVAYCQAKKTDTATDNTTTLNVLTSTDNGLTWVGAEVVDEDLKYPGPSFASGMFAQIGDDWFLCLSSRLKTTDYEGHIHIGNVRLFKGTAEDVINGSMSLYSVVDDFNTECTRSTVASSVSMTDTGNIGMTTDGKNLYIVYAKPLMKQATTVEEWVSSNSMLCLAVVNTSDTDISRQDSYYNENWETERDAFVSAKDMEHNLYIYGSGTTVVTNANGIDIMTPETHKNSFGVNAMANGYVVPNGDIQIPFTDYIEMRMVFGLANRFLSPDYKKQYYGINVGGIKCALTGSVNAYKFNETNSTGCAASLTTLQQLCDFRLKYKNGIVSATLNGVTIDDVRSYVVTDWTGFNDSENTAYLTFKDLAQIVLSGTGVGTNALMALTVDTDGDISDLLTAPPDDGLSGGDGETEEPEVIVENPVTYGLIHYFNVDDISDTTWPARVGGKSFTVASYDADAKLVTPGKTMSLGTNSALGIDTATGLCIETVTNMTGTGIIMQYSWLSANMGIKYAVGGTKFVVSGTNYDGVNIDMQKHFWKDKLLHTVLNLDVENGVAELYVNGVLKETVNAALEFGTEEWNFQMGTSDRLGNFRIYDRPLTAEEVANNYKYESYSYDFTEI